MTAPRWEKYPAGWKLSLAEGTIGILIMGRQEFSVCVQGVWDPKRYDSLDNAKEVGVGMVRKLLQEAAYELDLLRMQTPLSEHIGRIARPR